MFYLARGTILLAPPARAGGLCQSCNESLSRRRNGASDRLIFIVGLWPILWPIRYTCRLQLERPLFGSCRAANATQTENSTKKYDGSESFSQTHAKAARKPPAHKSFLNYDSSFGKISVGSIWAYPCLLIFRALHIMRRAYQQEEGRYHSFTIIHHHTSTRTW